MANPVNRTIIACSVSALALAITLFYWKLRKRRLLTTNSSSSSNGSCVLTGNISTEDHLDSLSQSNSSVRVSNKQEAYTPTQSTATLSLSSFPSFESDLGDKEVNEKFESTNVPTTSFGDIIFGTEGASLVDETLQVQATQIFTEYQDNSIEIFDKVQKFKEESELINQEQESLKGESEEIDSLRVEVSSVCSSTISKDIIEDSICGEGEIEDEEVISSNLSSRDNSDIDSLKGSLQAQEPEIENISPLPDMQINTGNIAAAVQNTGLNTSQKDAKPMNNVGVILSSNSCKNVDKHSILNDRTDGNSVSKVNEQLQQLQIDDKSKNINTELLKDNTQNGNIVHSNGTKKGRDRSSVNSDNEKKTSSTERKPIRTFNNRRPNQTFAQVLSAKAGELNGNGSSPQQPREAANANEMSIDAYQNYPDSPAQNSQCSPMSESSDQQSLHSSDSGAGSESQLNYVSQLSARHPPTLPQAAPQNGYGVEEICYEFSVPSELCGRLIGLKGHMINYIKSQSMTNCVISSNSLNPNSLKTCSVIGTYENVQFALGLIRQRFPIEDYPEMTMIQTNAIQVPTLELNNPCKLALLPDILNDAILACTINPGHIFVQQPTHPTHPRLSQLDYSMKLNYSQPNVPSVPQAVPGMICVARSGDEWFRAHVKSVSDTGRDCEIVFVDYGGFANVPVSSLKQIRLEFLNLPFQACECYLFNIEPVDEISGWSSDAFDYFIQKLANKHIYVHVIDVAEDQVPLVQLFTHVENSQTLCINTELVTNGHAKWIDESRAFN